MLSFMDEFNAIYFYLKNQANLPARFENLWNVLCVMSQAFRKKTEQFELWGLQHFCERMQIVKSRAKKENA